MTAHALVTSMRRLLFDMSARDAGKAADYVGEWDALLERVEALLEDRDRCGADRFVAPPPLEAPGRATCLHAQIVTEFGDGTREDPHVVALAIRPVGGSSRVLLVPRRELARMLVGDDASPSSASEDRPHA